MAVMRACTIGTYTCAALTCGAVPPRPAQVVAVAGGMRVQACQVTKVKTGYPDTQPLHLVTPCSLLTAAPPHSTIRSYSLG